VGSEEPVCKAMWLSITPSAAPGLARSG